MVEFAPLGPFHDGHADAFFVDLAAVGPVAAPADIHHVSGAGKESNELVAPRTPGSSR